MTTQFDEGRSRTLLRISFILTHGTLYKLLEDGPWQLFHARVGAMCNEKSSPCTNGRAS